MGRREGLREEEKSVMNTSSSIASALVMICVMNTARPCRGVLETNSANSLSWTSFGVLRASCGLRKVQSCAWHSKTCRVEELRSSCGAFVSVESVSGTWSVRASISFLLSFSCSSLSTVSLPARLQSSCPERKHQCFRNGLRRRIFAFHFLRGDVV